MWCRVCLQLHRGGVRQPSDARHEHLRKQTIESECRPSGDDSPTASQHSSIVAGACTAAVQRRGRAGGRGRSHSIGARRKQIRHAWRECCVLTRSLLVRQTHASKASLLDDEPVTSAEDVISSIFSIIRDFAARQKVRLLCRSSVGGPHEHRGSHSALVFAVLQRSVLDYAQVEAMVLRKGFTSAQLNNCLDEYELIGVLTLGDDRTEIRLDT